jgi:3-hydroxyisobutyrate dehydrogenase
MGRHMAAQLMQAGHHLAICDVRPEARQDPLLEGAVWLDTPKAVAEQSGVVITSLPGPTQVDAVVLGPDGILAGAHAGDVYIDMTTSSPRSIRAIAAVAADSGVEVLDAPVAGGIRGARHGTLTIMVGGHRETFERCEPILRTMGKQIFLVGDVGAGHVAKLVNNMMTIVNGLTAMEAMVVGTSAGVDPQKLLEVVEAGTGNSYSLNLFRYVIFKGNFEPAKFALSLAAKDLQLSVDFARELGVPLSIVTSASAAMIEAMSSGLADKDWSSYITLLEHATGVQVRA